MPTKRELKEIDRIVDTVIHNPENAAKLKEVLHGDLGRVPATSIPKSVEDDEEDLWDNLPV